MLDLHALARVSRGLGHAAAVLLAGALGLAGCAATLPYRPAEQPAGLTLAAGVRVVETRLRVEIDSDGYRVERAALVRPDGTEVEAEALLPQAAGSGVTFGLGVGAGGWGSGGSYSVGTGIGIPLGGPAGGGGRTVALFRLDESGPPPWRLRLKVVGVQPVEILLDPARPAGS
jgi:hypothetical protein